LGSKCKKFLNKKSVNKEEEKNKKSYYNYLLASEVIGVGDIRLFPLLIKTFKDLCNENSIILLSHRYRAGFEHQFFELASRYFSIQFLTQTELKSTDLSLHSDSVGLNEKIIIYQLMKWPQLDANLVLKKKTCFEENPKKGNTPTRRKRTNRNLEERNVSRTSNRIRKRSRSRSKT